MNFTFADLFAGIGGFHIALNEIGGKCVMAAEIDKFARQTYEANFKKENPELFGSNLFIEDVNNISSLPNIPDIDIISAGFPCQPFSHAGLKKGFEDTRGTLFHSIVNLAKMKIEEQKQNPATRIPKVLFLENVKGLKNHDSGNTLDVIIGSLEELEYETSYKVLNSKEFGLPQNRERLFIVAWRKELSDDFIFPTPPNTPTKVEDILDDLTDEEIETFTISDKLWAGHKRRKREHRAKGNGFGYSLFNEEDKYTSTMSARYYKDGSEILIDQGNDMNPRKIAPREAAKLQGYPEDFIIPVSNTQAYKQFGNSVSVPVIKAIAEEIKSQLFKDELNNQQKLAV